MQPHNVHTSNALKSQVADCVSSISFEIASRLYKNNNLTMRTDCFHDSIRKLLLARYH